MSFLVWIKEKKEKKTFALFLSGMCTTLITSLDTWDLLLCLAKVTLSFIASVNLFGEIKWLCLFSLLSLSLGWSHAKGSKNLSWLRSYWNFQFCSNTAFCARIQVETVHFEISAVQSLRKHETCSKHRKSCTSLISINSLWFASCGRKGFSALWLARTHSRIR